ncbi:hypothetical protein IWQ62_004970 [Dispira parvispora]|uniref:Spermatogenesis-associated protein 20-like TRX domain-containing protein n=1 Tax=Dispira parvispora TaxID=1520584 RepID=A0A9W8AQU1_9FUNG|nr:hypothetical protein IWQ62_004970 [Dispira parvispora]
MTYVQATTGGGGWPMSVFLTPDLHPFFGGTYFPPKDRFNTPGFTTILHHLDALWRQKGDKVRESSARIMGQLQAALAGTAPEKSPESKGETFAATSQAEAEHALLGWTVVDRAYRALTDSFDSKLGGFTRAPKFPTPVTLDFLLALYEHRHLTSYPSLDQLRHFSPEELQGIQTRLLRTNGTELSKIKADGDSVVQMHTQLQARQRQCDQALAMTQLTLRCIAWGGIHDHVGRGFHRYSVDGEWHVPHFEKMLYDQAQLVHTFTQLYALTGNSELAATVHDIIAYVRQDLTSPEGGFYSAEDADSLPTPDSTKKLEGAFYVWTIEELESVLGVGPAALFAYHYDVKPKGNVDKHKDPHGDLAGKNVLIRRHDNQATLGYYQSQSQTTLAEVQLEPPTEVGLDAFLENCRDKLIAYRDAHRPRPHRDNKVVTCWNGLMISGCARAAAVLDQPTYCNLAIGAAEFIRSHLYRADAPNPLLRSWFEGPSTVHGFADDYAFLIRGLLDLYEATLDIQWLTWARDLQSVQDRLFWDNSKDDSAGGYFFTTGTDDTIILRFKDDHDGAEPSYNSVSVGNLMRLYGYFNQDMYKTRAEQTLRASRGQLDEFPQSSPAMLTGLMQILRGNTEIIVASAQGNSDPMVQSFLREIYRQPIPNRVLMMVGPEPNELTRCNPVAHEIQAELAKALESGGEPSAVTPKVYICENFTCGLPITSLEALHTRLKAL